MLELAAEILGSLVDEVVFVGGATVHLWITEEAAPPVRATDDVDVICDITTYSQYQALAEKLRNRGLGEASGEPIICRWRHRPSGLAIDVMPTAEKGSDSRTAGTRSESKRQSSEHSPRECPSAPSRHHS